MSDTLKVPTMAQMAAEGKTPEVLFWVGCAGSFDARAQKITRAVAKILTHANVSFAVLGTEEGCTGDPAKPPPKDRVDSLLDDILKNQQSTTKVQTPEQQPKPVQQVTRQAPAAPQFASVVTASEIEGVRQKIRPCWNVFGGSKEAPIVSLVVQMNQDGTPVKAEFKDTGRYNNDPTYRAAADAAHRAIMNPRCQPWPLSSEKFTNWRTITFNFDPRDY